MNLLAITAIFSLPVACTLAYFVGVQRGRDLQWVDDYIANAGNIRARRDRSGRFVRGGAGK